MYRADRFSVGKTFRREMKALSPGLEPLYFFPRTLNNCTTKLRKVCSVVNFILIFKIDKRLLFLQTSELWPPARLILQHLILPCREVSPVFHHTLISFLRFCGNRDTLDGEKLDHDT